MVGGPGEEGRVERGSDQDTLYTCVMLSMNK